MSTTSLRVFGVELAKVEPKRPLPDLEVWVGAGDESAFTLAVTYRPSTGAWIARMYVHGESAGRIGSDNLIAIGEGSTAEQAEKEARNDMRRRLGLVAVPNKARVA